MTPNDLFSQALPLESPWKVIESKFEGDPRQLRIVVELEEGTKLMPCPECGGQCRIHDRKQRRWRHLNFWQHQTELTALVPRVKCEKCGVRQVDVPWARSGSGFTLLFEAMALLLVQQMSVSEAAATVGVHDTRLWRIVHHYVGKAHEGSDWSELKRVGVDETSRRKGHHYVTNFVDLDTGNLLFMTKGKDGATVEQFALQLPGHHALAEAIKEVAMDMSQGFQSGVKAHLPDAKIVFDRYHVMALAGEALDKVRKEVSQEVGGLEKGAMWSLRGNVGRLSTESRKQRERLCRDYTKLGRGMAIKEFLADTWKYTDRELAEEHLRAVVSWMARCRLESFKELGKTIKKHWNGILNYYNNWTTSGIMEGINSKLQLARRRARGYRNIDNFRAIAYWIAGDLRPAANLPNPIPAPF